MQKIKTIFLTVMISVGLIASANAHNPKMHMKKAEKAHCEKIANMDHSKIKSTDIVMMAMMKKCKQQAKEEMEHHHDDADEAGEPHHHHDDSSEAEEHVHH